MTTSEWFSRRVLAWYRRHGRHDLPWQNTGDPYWVWVSEIMLQQTQVATVIPFYRRFVASFPTVTDLAEASLDEVLALWSGLGYYARARNMHRAAQLVAAEHGGRFPDDFETLQRLPGVGRSTAAAVAALAGGHCHAILDGNVKRILSRFFALAHAPSDSAGQRRLWQWAESLTPRTGVADYTQAMMDLGATVCTRGRPLCRSCPVNERCAAYRLRAQAHYPVPRQRRRRPVRVVRVLLVTDPDGAVLLERRPPAGVWGGLWSLPELADGRTPDDWCRSQLGQSLREQRPWQALRHGLTHFELEMAPIHVILAGRPADRLEQGERFWLARGAHPPGGMPAPVTRLIGRL